MEEDPQAATTTSAGTERAARPRKQVEFFAPVAQKHTQKLVVKEGKGTKLGDIPNVAFKLGKITGRDELLEDFHFLLFRRKGKLATRKREVAAFSGFTWGDEDKEKERASLEERLGRWKVEHLNRLLDLLDVVRGSGEEGAKEKKLARLVQFLQAPEVTSTTDLAAREAKRKKAGKPKKRKGEEGEPFGSAKKRKLTDCAKRRPTKKACASTNGHAGSDEDPALPDDDDDDDDDIPLASVAAMPSNKVLREEVLRILQGVDVQEFNLSMLMQQLHNKFQVDLKLKKPLIKNTAIEYCASQGPDDDHDEEEEEEEEERVPSAAKSEPPEAGIRDFGPEIVVA
ncbi:hypothetical protein WJX72_001206 [[Myrmecia] bisecta]|uniref:DEK-C domain-containing protein n=1 Tax=[Myrmecia] bisecta TaxID=41462 RepID=A0AAW1P8T7_9CHLO